MPLVEVIAARGAIRRRSNTVFAFTRKLGKTPILVKDAPGFLVNRLLMFYSTEALWLLDEGYRIEDLDRAMSDWGMPMGPIALPDEVGIDVAAKVAHILHDAFGERLPRARLARPRRRRAAGWARRTARASTATRGASARSRTPRSTPCSASPRGGEPGPGPIADRMVLPMVNEAARCLEEGVVRERRATSTWR